MDWPILLAVIFGSLLVLMATGLPIAFCFIVINIIGVILLWGGESGLQLLISSFFSSLNTFTFIPVPMFILMGDVLFFSGLAPMMMDAVDKWIGRVPGRLSLVAVGSGTLLATLTGASMASVAMLGSSLAPEMKKKGYKTEMIVGPIMGAGGLAVLIPPSSLAVILGSIGQISIGGILIGCIVPGILLAAIYIAYIILRCTLQPELAPRYEVAPPTMQDKLISTAKYIVPTAVVIFLVTGVILLGIATPTEAAVTGCVGSFILAAGYRKLNWTVAKKSFLSALNVSVMMMAIIMGSQAFSQIMAFSGASAGLSQWILGYQIAPILIIAAMQIVLFVLGMFISIVPIMMITLPIFMPVIHSLGFNPVWFAVIYMINMEVAMISPPFGVSMFVMKSVAPDIKMEDIIKSGIPIIFLELFAMALIFVFPQIALWLPGLMRSVGS